MSRKVLVINCGSSSVKFELYLMPEEQVEARGVLEKIGEEGSRLTCRMGGTTVEIDRPVADHAEGFRLITATLTDPEHGGLEDLEEIGAVGHRVVHGGEAFAGTTLITDEVVRAVEDHIDLAPLHNPPNLTGIQAARDLLPGVPQVAVFDTAFHLTIPEHAYIYPVPFDLYTESRVRRYGFHGTSHRYVSRRAAELLGRPREELNLITCHLGNGCSMAAIREGRSVDTSMGLTPLEGLMMGTRCGDIDPALPAYLERVRGMTIQEVDTLLNKQSGLAGVSGVSNDMREVRRAAKGGDERAALAIEMYCYRIKKYVGAYTAVLGRVDAVIFTAGVGENNPSIREKAMEGLAPLGYVLDPDRNRETRGEEADIAAEASRVRILVVPTDEELLIARDTHRIARLEDRGPETT